MKLLIDWFQGLPGQGRLSHRLLVDFLLGGIKDGGRATMLAHEDSDHILELWVGRESSISW